MELLLPHKQQCLRFKHISPNPSLWALFILNNCSFIIRLRPISCQYRASSSSIKILQLWLEQGILLWIIKLIILQWPDFSSSPVTIGLTTSPKGNVLRQVWQWTSEWNTSDSVCPTGHGSTRCCLSHHAILEHLEIPKPYNSLAEITKDLTMILWLK